MTTDTTERRASILDALPIVSKIRRLRSKLAAARAERDGLRAQLDLLQKIRNVNKPDILQVFENLYDVPSGGWYLPPDYMLCGGFRHLNVDAWAKKCIEQQFVNFAPVELEVGNLYHWFVRLTKPSWILETGTAQGYSTCMLAAGLRTYNMNGRIYSLDLVPTDHLFKNTELEENIDFIAGNSLEVNLNRLAPPGGLFDLLVLDSDHSYGTIMGELVRFDPLLRTGGLILLHDSLYYDGVGLAVLELMRNPRFDVVTLETPRRHCRNTRSPGITVARKLSGGLKFPLAVDLNLTTVEQHASDERDDWSPPVVEAFRSGHDW